MGFNSTVIVLNDALHLIREDKDFGRKLADAISHLSLGPDVVGRYGVDISSGGHCNAATAIESHHADMNAIVAVGGNCATQLGVTFGFHHKPESKLEILKQLADGLGYTLRKKPESKKS